jgi:carboxylesterase
MTGALTRPAGSDQNRVSGTLPAHAPYDEPMPADVRPEAEPFSAWNGPHGVLVLHGFTGNPSSVRPLAEAFADAGFSVELPRLPGHGTSVDDLMVTRWADWAAAADESYTSLAARCDRTVVAGLSMGGTLSLWLALHHADVAAAVLVNPLAEPPADSFMDMMHQLVESGGDRIPSIGSDIAQPGAAEWAYEATPLPPLLSLFEAVGEIAPRLPEIVCPVLLFSSRTDHVVPPSSGDLVAAMVGGPLERIFLERSYHVATLDYDQQEIEERAVGFVSKAVSA